MNSLEPIPFHLPNAIINSIRGFVQQYAIEWGTLNIENATFYFIHKSRQGRRSKY